MNHIYRVVYNHHTHTYQAVSEISKGVHKTHSECNQDGTFTQSSLGNVPFFRTALTTLAVVITALGAQRAHAAPTDGQVVAGQANIAQAGAVTNIHQASQNAVINWQQFGIKADETVNFKQPNAQSVTLNRVIGNEKSVIDGAMNANGKVFITNPNGVMIGNGAKINVGALLATTGKISDSDFMAGNYRFQDATGAVENYGEITVPEGGAVALIAPVVRNQGTIKAPQGNALLASAEQFSVTLQDDSFAYTLDKGTLQGLVDNGGAIYADAGHIVLTAKGVDMVKKSLIKHSGIAEANTVRSKNGVIELLGDLDNTRLEVSGTLKAEAKAQGDGGFIETSAAQVKIEDNTEVSTKAENGKTGTWLIDPTDFIIAPDGDDDTNGSTISGKSLTNALKQTDMIVRAMGGTSKTDKGDVIVNDDVTWSKHTLTLNAHNDIYINKTMNGSGTAKLALEYGQGTADGRESDYHIKHGVKVNLPMGNTLITKKGKDGEKIEFTVIHQMPDIIKYNNRAWDAIFTTHNIAFGKDIDVGYTKNFEGFAGWQLPRYGREPEWGRVAGLGHTVSNLTLYSNGQVGSHRYTGLFKEQHNTLEGYIRDIGVINANIKSDGSSAYTGGLLGAGDNIHNSYVIGNISTTGEGAIAGGLVGYGSNITNSYATGNISTTGEGAIAGGLVGYGSNITNSYATGNVQTGGNNSDVGGLLGHGFTITNSYATGNVSSTGHGADAGGLVGYGFTITNSYATGDVSATGDIANAGGLVGLGDNVTNSYANSNQVIASGKDSYAGGVIGYQLNPTHSRSVGSNNFFNQDRLPKLEAIGKIDSGVAPSITNVTGKTDSELKQKSTFAGWDETIWDIQDGKLPTLRHTANTVTTPTVPPVTPPINNVDFEPAKKSLADTKLYRQNMLNRMVIFAKNGEFTKLNIDQINDNIRKEIAKTQALIDTLPDGAEKTNLQNQLNAIMVLTRDEIQNAEKVSNDVAKEKQKEQQRKEQAEKDKKDAYEAVSSLEKSRQAILDNYYNQAKQGTLLDNSNINQTLSQAWLNTKNKVNKVTEQSEQTNLNNRLSILGVLTQAEIDRAKAFVKAYQDNQARLEEEKKRAEEAKRRAEQAKEQERIQALFKDAQNLVQQAKEFADRSQSLVDNGRTNDVATLNKNLTERKQQAQASIDKLPNNATKTLLQRQLNEIALVKANGGVNNPPNTNTPPNNTGTNNTPNIPTPIKPQEPKDKLELYKEQANVTKPQPEYRPDLMKKPEKSVELQRNDDFVNTQTQTFNTNNQKPVFLTQSELNEVDNLFYEIDTSGENVNSFINFIENGITPKTYLQLGIGELEKSIQQLDNTLMQNAIGRIQNLQVTTSYKAEDALLVEGVNSAVAKKMGIKQ